MSLKTAPPTGPSQGGGSEGTGEHAVRVALASALKLGLSLVGTVLVSIGLNIWLPRRLGPEPFGQLNWAEALATSLFAFTTFGIDTYIRKEVSSRPKHADDFYGGFVLLRLVASGLVLGIMAAILVAQGRAGLDWRLAYLYAAGQICILLNFTESALLQAISRVNELAWANVLAKVLGAGSVCLALVLGAPLESVALCLFLAEAAKAGYLTAVAHRALNLQWRIDMRATWAVVVASFPFFLNNIAHRTYEKLNVTILGSMANDSEVGWYAGAARLAGISLLFIPIVQAVVIPMASRMARRSEEAMNEVMRGAVRLVLVGGALIGLVLVLHTRLAVHLTLGPDFGPSALSLQVLAPMFTLTYMAVLGAAHLIQLNRVWLVIKVSLAALVFNPLLNVPCVWAGMKMGPGWAGAMSALSSVVTEGINAAILFAALGRRAVDARLIKVAAATLAACLAVVGVHGLLPLAEGWQMVLEVVAFVGLVVALGALPLAEVVRLIRQAPRGGARGEL